MVFGMKLGLLDNMGMGSAREKTSLEELKNDYLTKKKEWFLKHQAFENLVATKIPTRTIQNSSRQPRTEALIALPAKL